MIVLYRLQKFESYGSDDVAGPQLRGLGVDVEAAVVDTGVLALVEEVVELQLQVDVLQLELGGGIAEPGMAVLGGLVVVVVLGGEGQREGLGRIDAHGEALGVAAHGGRLFAAALGVTAALGEAAAIDDANPLEGAERETAAETESLGVVLVEALADETLALGEAVAAEDADGGAQEVEALAGLAADAVVAGGGGLVDSLHDAGGSLVVVAVDLVVVGATVVEADVGEEGADGAAVAQADVGAVVFGLGQLLDVAALEGAVV